MKERLRAEVGEDVFQSWFARMELEGIEDITARLSVPTRFLKSWIQSHYVDRVLACWQQEHPRFSRSRSTSAARSSAPCRPRPSSRSSRSTSRDPRLPRLDIGDLRAAVCAGVQRARRARRLAARSAADLRNFRRRPLQHAGACGGQAGGGGAPRRAGDVQSALHPCRRRPRQDAPAAGHDLGRQQRRPTARCSISRPRSSCTASSRRCAPRRRSPSRRRLRGIDVLVIDDLQFLQGKSTQAEFCHTLNALIDAGRQVVIAADRPPTDLESLDDRVRSRLAGGLVVEMGPLGEELRLEILKTRVAAARQHHPGFDVPAPVLAYIAKIGHPQRPRSRRRAQPPAGPQQAHRPAGDDGDGRARGARPDPPAGAQARQDRGHPAHRGAAIQCQPRRSAVVAPDRQRGAARGRSRCIWPRP